MKAIGLDIGTTSICVTVTDAGSGECLLTLNAKSGADLSSPRTFERIQDPEVIFQTARGLVDRAIDRTGGIDAIGLTGQMHGIVYLDADGRTVSPLFTWQDGRGDQPYADGMSYAQWLSEKTGYELAPGYGSVTHFYNMVNREVPPDAAAFCTIHDYCAMRLAGASAPLTHISDAASLGLFDLAAAEFDRAAAEQSGMEASLFPQVTAEVEALGRYREATVFTAVGDNQASFIGSVSDMEDTILVNVGTGSQISVYLPGPYTESGEYGDFECRPCTGEGILLAGCSLCGGRAYALLESFFLQTAHMAGADCDSLFAQMDRLAEEHDRLENRLEFSTLFDGTRKDPGRRAGVGNLGLDNFTPGHFVCGVIDGTVNELYEFFTQAPILRNRRFSRLIGSGNGIRKGGVMRQVFAQRFGMPLCVPLHKEEAAYGASLLALTAAGAFPDLRAAQRLIQYSK